MTRKRGDRTGKSGPSKFLPRREGATGATISTFVRGYKGMNAMYTWRRRRAEALWKAAQHPNPGTVLANDSAQKIARQIVAHLCQFAPCTLGGMVGAYWHGVLSRRVLWQDEAQNLAVQVNGLCRLAVAPSGERRNVGKRSPGHALSLDAAYTAAANSGAPLDEKVKAALAHAREHPYNEDYQAAVAEYLASQK